MTNTWKRIRTLVPIILLTMILARLVWIQLRVFPFEVTDRARYALTYLEAFSGSECAAPVLGESPLPAQDGDPAATHAVEIWLTSPLYTLASGLGCNANLLT